MQFTGLGIGLALLILLLAAHILITKHWLLGWLRGMMGLSLLAVSVLGGLILCAGGCFIMCGRYDTYGICLFLWKHTGFNYFI